MIGLRQPARRMCFFASSLPTAYGSGG